MMKNTDLTSPDIGGGNDPSEMGVNSARKRGVGEADDATKGMLGPKALIMASDLFLSSGAGAECTTRSSTLQRSYS